MEFESIVPLIKNLVFFISAWLIFLNKLKLSDQKYQTNGNLRYDNYNGKSLFTMKNVLSFSTDNQSMYFMSTRFLKGKINGVCVTEFQLA